MFDFLVHQKHTYWKPVTFSKNLGLKFFFFDNHFQHPEDICISHLLQSSSMPFNSYEITAPYGLFSSVATEEHENDHVTFYKSPFVHEKYFCLLAKQDRGGDRWINTFVGEVL
jgi:hypothetical protein